MANLAATYIDGRFFVPRVRPNNSTHIIEAILPHTKTIAFDLKLLLRSGKRDEMRRKGLHDYFNISSSTEIYLITNGEDDYLKNYYSEDCVTFKKDVYCFRPDWTMAPDWWSYREDSPKEREECFEKACKMTEQCGELDGLLPTINATDVNTYERYIAKFSEKGYRRFVIQGREYLMRAPGYRTDEANLANMMELVGQATDAELIINGTSNPRQHRFLPVNGFIGLQWMLSAANRLMLFDGVYKSIMREHNLFCSDNRCCGGEFGYNLRDKSTEQVMALHNLLRIQEGLKEPMERPKQTRLGGIEHAYYGSC